MGVLKPGTFALRPAPGSSSHHHHAPRSILHEAGQAGGAGDEQLAGVDLRETARYMERINQPPETALFPLVGAAGDAGVCGGGGSAPGAFRRMRVLIQGDACSEHAHPFSVAVAKNGCAPSGVRQLTVDGCTVHYNMARAQNTSPVLACPRPPACLRAHCVCYCEMADDAHCVVSSTPSLSLR